MHLVALGWIYVVLMMALAEAISPQGTVLGAFFTLLLYGLLPLALVLYIMGRPGRRRARERTQAQADSVAEPAAQPSQASAAPELMHEPGAAAPAASRAGDRPAA